MMRALHCFTIVAMLPLFGAEASLSLERDAFQNAFYDATQQSAIVTFAHRLTSEDTTLSLHFSLRLQAQLQGNDPLYKSVSGTHLDISNLHLRYYTTPHSVLAVGRFALDYDLLQGSFDGLLAAYNYGKHRFTGMLFSHYALFESDYRETRSFSSPLRGVSWSYGGEKLQAGALYLHALSSDRLDLYLQSDREGLGGGIEALYLRQNGGDEKALIWHLDYRDGASTLSYRETRTGKNGLKAIFDLGNTPAIRYGLNGYLDRGDSIQRLLNYCYDNNDMRLEIQAGKTRFAANTGTLLGASFTIPTPVGDLSLEWLRSFSDEAGILGKAVNYLGISLSYRIEP